MSRPHGLPLAVALAVALTALTPLVPQSEAAHAGSMTVSPTTGSMGPNQKGRTITVTIANPAGTVFVDDMNKISFTFSPGGSTLLFNATAASATGWTDTAVSTAATNYLNFTTTTSILAQGSSQQFTIGLDLPSSQAHGTTFGIGITGYETDVGNTTKTVSGGFTVSVDAVKPTLTSAVTIDLDQDGLLDRYNLTFSEPIQDSSFTPASWTVTGATGLGFSTGATANDALASLTFTEALGTGAKPNITVAANAVRDAAGNGIDLATSISETDGAPPILLLAHGNITSSALFLRFSEPVNGTRVAAGALNKGIQNSDLTYTSVGTGGTVTGLHATTQPSHNNSTAAGTVTLNGVLAVADRGNDTIAAKTTITDLAGLQARTTPVTVLTDTTPPAAITNLAKGLVTTSSVQLNWTTPTATDLTGGSAGFVLRYITGSTAITESVFSTTPCSPATATCPANVAVSITPASGTAQTLTVTGLAAGTTYQFAIKTRDRNGNLAALSNVASATTATDSSPPTGTITVSSSTHADQNRAYNNKNPGFSWTAAADPQSTVNYATAIAKSATYAPGASENTTTSLSRNYTNVPDGVWYFHVRAGSAGGQHADTVHYKFTIDTVAPRRITDLTIEQTNATTVRLGWTAPGDDDGAGTVASYDVRSSTGTITNDTFDAATVVSGAPSPTAAGTHQSLTVSGLLPNTSYTFAVRGKDDADTRGAVSNVVSARTSTDNTPPGTTLTVTSTTHPANTDTLDNSPRFRWNAAADPESTDIRYFYALKQETGYQVGTADQSTAETTVSFAGIAVGTWTFYVRAHSTGGFGPQATYTIVIDRLSAEEIRAANDAVSITVKRSDGANEITFEIPDDTPAEVAGVQVWRSNSPYELVETVERDDFETDTTGRVTDSGDKATSSTKYLVTLFYGKSAELGYFLGGQAPTTEEYDGVSASATVPWWVWAVVAAIVLIVALVIVVLVVRRRRALAPIPGSSAAYDEPVPEATAEIAPGDWAQPALPAGQAQGGDWWQGDSPAAAPAQPMAAAAPGVAAGSAGSVAGWAPETGALQSAETVTVKCPSCQTQFSATGVRPFVTNCPGCGVKGVLK